MGVFESNFDFFFRSISIITFFKLLSLFAFIRIITMSEEFNKAAADVEDLKEKPNNDELGKLYGLYKQVTCGDNDTACPGMLDFTGKAKWNAWNANKGKSKEECETAYIELVNELIGKYGLK